MLAFIAGVVINNHASSFAKHCARIYNNFCTKLYIIANRKNNKNNNLLNNNSKVLVIIHFNGYGLKLIKTQKPKSCFIIEKK